MGLLHCRKEMANVSSVQSPPHLYLIRHLNRTGLRLIGCLLNIPVVRYNSRQSDPVGRISIPTLGFQLMTTLQRPKSRIENSPRIATFLSDFKCWGKKAALEVNIFHIPDRSIATCKDIFLIRGLRPPRVLQTTFLSNSSSHNVCSSQ